MVFVLVIATFALFIALNIIVRQRQAALLAKQSQQVDSKAPLPESQGDLYPEKLHFSRGHTWARVDKATVTIGLDDFTQRFTGPLDAIETLKVGDRVKKGKPIWTLKFGDKTIVQRAPVSGRVQQVNPDMLADPATANISPYNQGWVLKILPESLHEEREVLLEQHEFMQWNDRIRNILLGGITPELGAVYADAGELRSGIGRNIKPEQWDELVEMLFDPDE